MKIRRIQIRAFRKLVEPVDICGLGDGVIVLSGHNEEGKSTVLKALRTVLFERHRLTGEAAHSLLPWGSTVRPEVTLEFELAGASYTVRKGFCQQPFAELRTPQGTITGPRVEEELGRLLGFQAPGRGPAGEQHQGVFGLLWVEQGTSCRLEVAPGTRRTLQSALEAEVGAVLGGERGQELLAAIERLYREQFDARGHPRGEWKKTREHLERLEDEVRTAREELSSYDRQVDELSRLRERLRCQEAGGQLERAQDELARARQQQQRLSSLAAELERARQKTRLAEAEWNSASASWARREQEIQAEREARAAARGAQERRQEQAQRAAQARSAAQAAHEALARSEKAREEAAAQVLQAERLLQRAREATALAELHLRLGQARAAAAQQQRAAQQAQTLSMDRERLGTLRELEHRALQAEAALAAAATRIELQLRPGVTVRRDGQQVGAGPLLLVGRTELEIDGVGTLIVIPGGEDLSERRRSAQDARRQLESALAEGGVADVAAAEEQVRQREALLAEVRHHEQILLAHAPQGLEALEADVARAEAKLEDSDGDGLSAEEAGRYLEEGRTRLEAVEDEVRCNRVAWECQRAVERDEAERLARAEAERDAAERAWQQAAAALAAARQQPGDAELAAARERTRQDLEAAQAAEAAARAALEQADPDGVQRHLQMCEEAVRRIQDELHGTRQRIRDLEIELRTLGQRGLGERLQELEGELEQTRAALEQRKRHAAAVRLLWDALKRAEKRARESFAAPVAQRMRPYLHMLLPGTEISLCNTSLSIQHLHRDGRSEPFEALSAGTREQIAVLCRLAFADLLRERGQAAAVVLDDALVYSDEDRFQRMLQVLRYAGQAQQVLILTCRERDYLSAGFPVVRLADCRR